VQNANYAKAPAVFLTIDSATASGVALSAPELRGKKVESYCAVTMGLVRSQRGREGHVNEAVSLAKDEGLPLIVVGEEWTPHGISTATFASLCESWGKWLAALERGGVPETQILRVAPNTWRAAVFGKNRPKTSVALKEHACKHVERALSMHNLHHDLAEALCLRLWGEHAGEVHAVLAALKKPDTKRRAPKSSR